MWVSQVDWVLPCVGTLVRACVPAELLVHWSLSPVAWFLRVGLPRAFCCLDILEKRESAADVLVQLRVASRCELGSVLHSFFLGSGGD